MDEKLLQIACPPERRRVARVWGKTSPWGESGVFFPNFSDVLLTPAPLGARVVETLLSWKNNLRSRVSM